MIAAWLPPGSTQKAQPRPDGNPGKGAALELRESIVRGECSGPRLLCAGQPLTRPAGHCHQWGGAAGTDSEIRAVVARQIGNCVDWVKVMATGGVRTAGSNPAASAFSAREIRIAADMAHASGRRLAPSPLDCMRDPLDCSP